MFKKFKDKEKFIKLVNQFNVHKSTVTVEINIYKLCEKYSKLMKSSIGLHFLKDIKDIKDITKILKKFVIKTKRVCIMICSRLTTCLASDGMS